MLGTNVKKSEDVECKIKLELYNVQDQTHFLHRNRAINKHKIKYSN